MDSSRLLPAKFPCPWRISQSRAITSAAVVLVSSLLFERAIRSVHIACHRPPRCTGLLNSTVASRPRRAPEYLTALTCVVMVSSAPLSLRAPLSSTYHWQALAENRTVARPRLLRVLTKVPLTMSRVSISPWTLSRHTLNPLCGWAPHCNADYSPHVEGLAACLTPVGDPILSASKDRSIAEANRRARRKRLFVVTSSFVLVPGMRIRRMMLKAGARGWLHCADVRRRYRGPTNCDHWHTVASRAFIWLVFYIQGGDWTPKYA